ncbi:hypothetical protein F5Y16DRAFT_423229 [Xylariaceae sp. FL0255]|nr:hypothetical protein F5Y16DRAFT_423229 [Xylariaceae sp. FL0255]
MNGNALDIWERRIIEINDGGVASLATTGTYICPTRPRQTVTLLSIHTLNIGCFRFKIFKSSTSSACIGDQQGEVGSLHPRLLNINQSYILFRTCKPSSNSFIDSPTTSFNPNYAMAKLFNVPAIPALTPSVLANLSPYYVNRRLENYAINVIDAFRDNFNTQSLLLNKLAEVAAVDPNSKFAMPLLSDSNCIPTLPALLPGSIYATWFNYPVQPSVENVNNRLKSFSTNVFNAFYYTSIGGSTILQAMSTELAKLTLMYNCAMPPFIEVSAYPSLVPTDVETYHPTRDLNTRLERFATNVADMVRQSGKNNCLLEAKIGELAAKIKQAKTQTVEVGQTTPADESATQKTGKVAISLTNSESRDIPKPPDQPIAQSTDPTDDDTSVPNNPIGKTSCKRNADGSLNLSKTKDFSRCEDDQQRKILQVFPDAVLPADARKLPERAPEYDVRIPAGAELYKADDTALDEIRHMQMHLACSSVPYDLWARIAAEHCCEDFAIVRDFVRNSDEPATWMDFLEAVLQILDGENAKRQKI